MSANHNSPFVVGKPLRADKPIFGRDDAFQFIRDQLTHYSSINIVGERRMGKTSLLNHLLGNEAKYVPFLLGRPLLLGDVDLQGVNNVSQFYGAALLNLLSNPQVRKNEPARLRELRNRLESAPTAEGQEFQHVLRHLREVSRVRPVLVVDGFEQLLADGSASGFPYPAFFNNLRALIGDRHEWLAMVIASRRPLAEYFTDPRRPNSLTSTFPNYFPLFRLELLSNNDADQLLLQGGRLNNYEVRAARVWAKGHPCHLQAAGGALVENKQRQKPSEQWARARFEELIKNCCLAGTTLAPLEQSPDVSLGRVESGQLASTAPPPLAHPQPRRNWLLRTLRFIFITVPVFIGQQVQRIGSKIDELEAWFKGLVFILLLILILIGLMKGTDLVSWLKKIFGIGQ
jgi:uncharacterized protein